MRDSGGFETYDDDDLDGVLVEDETGVESRVPQQVAFEFALSDAGPATELGREAAELGYDVEMRSPDDGEGFYEVICSRTIAAGPAEVARARRELEALAEEFGCLAEDEERVEEA
jgi:hypothetical protein